MLCELTNKFSEVAEYKINAQNLVVFLCPNNEPTKKNSIQNNFKY